MRLQPRKRPRQQRAHQTLEVVLQAASKVFARHGFAHGTTNRIAEKAGISVGSLYEYFPNKESILLALSERHVAEGEAALRDFDPTLAAQLPLEQVARFMIAGIASLHQHDRALHRVLFEEAPRPPAFSRRLREAEDLAVEKVAALCRLHPEIRHRAPEAPARLVVRLIESLVHRWAADPVERPMEALVDELTEVVVSYLHR